MADAYFRFLVGIVLSAGGAAQAAQICAPIEGSRTEVTCVDQVAILDAIAAQEGDRAGPRPRVAEYSRLFDALQAPLLPSQVLVVDSDYRFLPREVDLLAPLEALYRLRDPLPPITDVTRQRRAAIQEQMLEDSVRLLLHSGGSLHENAGGNLDGQLLYGPPGDPTNVGCTGYSSIDGCKACCMASRGMLFGAIAAWTVKCHGEIAMACCVATLGFGCVGCHALCAVSEIAMIAGAVHLVDSCSTNCEDKWWIDQSVDWQGAVNQGLHWDDYAECEGWVDRPSSTQDPILLTETRRRGKANCALAPGNASYSDLFYLHARVRIIGDQVDCDGLPCIQAVDYRLLDVDVHQEGDQIPYVGRLQIDELEQPYFDRGAAGPLYLDGLPYWMLSPWLEGWKMWARGDRVGDRVAVVDYELILHL